MPDQNVDDLLKSMGKPGKFQLLVFGFLALNWAMIYAHHLTMVFYAAKAKYHCTVDDDNLVPIALKNNERQWDGCNSYAGNNTTATLPCTSGWTYYLESGEATIVSEFDLVCDDAYKADLATTVYFCGVALGGFPFGILSDRFGRKPVVGATLFATGTIGVAIVILRTYLAFVLLRFCLGFVVQGLQNSAFVLGVEFLVPEYRAHAGVATGLIACSGSLIFALLAYMVKDWKYIQLTISIVPFIQLFTLWFTCFCSFYGLSFNISYLFGNKYLNFAVGALLDVCALCVLLCVVPRRNHYWRNQEFDVCKNWFGRGKNVTSEQLLIWTRTFWFGRRKPLAVALLFCGLANVTCAITSFFATESKSVKSLRTAFALLGKSSVAGTGCVLFLFTAELYPTVFRSISLGVHTCWSRIGAMAAPQILLLGVFTLTAVPYSIIGGLALLSSFLITLLPETHNQTLVDRLRRTELMGTSSDEDILKVTNEEMVFETSL